MSRSVAIYLLIAFLTTFIASVKGGFVSGKHSFSSKHYYGVLSAESNSRASSSHSEEEPKKKGYQFGDLTRSLGRKITGDDNYQFGDISCNLDRRAKAGVESITGKPYVFGDLTRWTDSQIKEKIANYTGKETYEVGDLSKEVVRRVWEGHYDLEDVMLILRVLLQLGAQFTPIARLMPVKFLLEVLTVGLAQDVGGRVMTGVAKSLDERFKMAITGNPNYELGDKSKERIAQVLTKITGKDEYKFGDLTEVITNHVSEAEKLGGNNENSKNSKVAAEMEKALLDLSEDGALKDWDKKFMEESSKRKAN